MFGDWLALEKSPDVYNNIMEILESLIVTEELGFITGNHLMIVTLESKSTFEEISSFLDEFLTTKVTTYFIMPMPRKLSYRINPMLEEHLFGKKKNKLKKKVNPEVAKKLGEQLRSITKYKLKVLESLSTLIPQEEPPTKKLTLDGVLDKIHDKGIDSLTHNELKFLNNQSSKN